MRFAELLILNQTVIKRQWLESIIETYPADSREFFRKQKDQFQNPVGAAMSELVNSLFDALLQDASDAEIAVILEDFVKIRSVQEFSPSGALGFILRLKQIVREVLADEIESNKLFPELLRFDAQVDNLLLKAFDVYSQAREKLYTIRADELRRRSFMALRMKGSNSE